jgi:catechol 2,3-dioxygenase-like lactoylglutathione lyase family enzyme
VRLTHVGLLVRDYVRCVDFLAGPPHDRADWGVCLAYFRDPDGNLIEVNHSIPMTE